MEICKIWLYYILSACYHNLVWCTLEPWLFTSYLTTTRCFGSAGMQVTLVLLTEVGGRCGKGQRGRGFFRSDDSTAPTSKCFQMRYLNIMLPYIIVIFNICSGNCRILFCETIFGSCNYSRNRILSKSVQTWVRTVWPSHYRYGTDSWNTSAPQTSARCDKILLKSLPDSLFYGLYSLSMDYLGIGCIRNICNNSNPAQTQVTLFKFYSVYLILIKWKDKTSKCQLS